MSSDNNPKTTNGLMIHLRSKGLDINGSKQKRELMNIGYYHGYKGYRFVTNDQHPIPYTDFEQLKSIYDYDSNLKALFYPHLMTIETALKNRVLDIVVNDVKSSNFMTVFNNVLDDYKRLSLSGRTFTSANARQRAENDYTNAVKARNKLRDTFLKNASKAYSDKNRIAVHFQEKDLQVPLWGLFEMISLGDFGFFVKNSNLATRTKYSLGFGINPIYDTSAELPHRIIFTLKDLRNSIAHNNVIFDTRFRTANIDNSVKNMIRNETSIQVDFTTIFDYLVLIIFILKKLGMSKTQMRKIVIDFKDITEEVKLKLPNSIYNMFTRTSLRPNINLVLNYIKL